MKKILGLILTVILTSGLIIPTGVSAKTLDQVSEYEMVLNSINNEFNLELGYVSVDETKITVKEYEETTRKVAKEQKELLDYIARRNNKDQIVDDKQVISRAIVTKTRSKDAWGLTNEFYITTTYDVNGSLVYNFRNSSVNQSWSSTILGSVSLAGISGPSYSSLDGGRTGGVKFTGDIIYKSGVTYKNYTIYAEFTSGS